MSEFPKPNPALGIFETLLVVDGAPLEIDAHLDRLAASTRALFDAAPPAGARELLLESASPLSLGRVRLTLAPGESEDLRAETVSAVVDPASVFPSWDRAVALHPLVVPGGLGAHKWADRSGLVRAEADEPDDGLRLLLDGDGEVLEASRANVFAVEGQLLITPATDGRILPGVTRASALETIAALGLELREEPLTIERLTAAGEAFLTGAVRGIEPVRAIGEAELRPPGEAVSAIAEALRRAWLGARTSDSVASR